MRNSRTARRRKSVRERRSRGLALLLILPAGLLLGVLGGKAVDPSLETNPDAIGGNAPPPKLEDGPDFYERYAAPPQQQSAYRPELDYDAEVWPGGDHRLADPEPLTDYAWSDEAMPDTPGPLPSAGSALSESRPANRYEAARPEETMTREHDPAPKAGPAQDRPLTVRQPPRAADAPLPAIW